MGEDGPSVDSRASALPRRRGFKTPGPPPSGRGLAGPLVGGVALRTRPLAARAHWLPGARAHRGTLNQESDGCY